MGELQDSAQPARSSSVIVKNSASESASGWEADFEDDKINYKLIKLANEKSSLFSLLKNYGIKFIKNDYASGWTHKSSCPFPNHRDSTPSFGYNSINDIFHCFGCQRSGGTVQFISYMESRPQIEVAREILGTFGNLYDSIDYSFDDQKSKIDDLLINFSTTINNLIDKHKNNNLSKILEHIDNITWNLDVYLENNALRGSIDFENVEARITKIKEFLEALDNKLSNE